MSELFRKQAVDHAFRRLDGEVFLATPLSVRLLSAVLIGVIFLGAVFACVGSYSRKETVQGWIAPPGGLIRVIARQGGTIETLNLTEGAMVARNEPVATLRLSNDIEGADAGASLLANMRMEAEAADAGLGAAEARISSTRASLTAQRAMLTQEAGEASKRLRLAEERQKTTETAAARAEALYTQGYLTLANLETQRNAVSLGVQELSSSRSAMLSTARQIEELDRQLGQLPVELADARAKAGQARASLAQRQINAETQSLYGVSAPLAGRVVAAPVEHGQALPPGATIAVIAPQGADLLAELYVPSRAAGFIKPGQEVKLMYQAFPYQKFGVGRAQVASVSRTVLGPGEISIPGLEFREPVFRVRARLSRQYVEAYGERVFLQPGMLLSADIVIDRRTLLEWLLDPLYAAGRRR